MSIKRLTWVVGLTIGTLGGTATASHFRGAAIVPSIDSQGVLTLEVDSFWAKGDAFSSDHQTFGFQISGGAVSNYTRDSFVVDESDARRSKATTIFTADLSTAGTYTINWDSCCHQSGIPNVNAGWNITSEISWDGVNATQPIFFDLENIQQQVIVNSPYSDNLDATAGAGLTLSYDGTLNPDVTSQAPGLMIDPNTGQLTIPAASIGPGSSYVTAPTGVAFAGNIYANDATGAQQGLIGYEWLFLDCDPAQQNCAVAPEIQDVVVNALIGDVVNQTMLAVEDAGQMFQAPNLLTAGWDALQSFNCSGGAPGNAPSFNSGTQAFSWDSTGTATGQCTAIFRVTDAEGLTDTGSLLINLTNTPPPPPPPPPPGVPVPAPLALLGLGLLGLGAVRRKK